MRQFAFLAMLAFGCQRAPQVGVTAQDLSQVWYYSFGCAGNCGNTDLGTTTGRTCFIAGVRGNLAPTSSVYISSSGGHWWLNVSSSVNGTLWGDATCVSSGTNRTSEFVQAGNGTTTIPAGVTGNRRCFLTRVASNIGVVRPFSQYSDRVRVVKQPDGTWDLTVAQGTGANATGGVTCVDTSGSGQGFGLEEAPDPGFVSDNVDTDITNTACALRGIGGHFDTNGSTDAARIEPLATPPDMAVGPLDAGTIPPTAGWWAESHNGKRAWWGCVN